MIPLYNIDKFKWDYVSKRYNSSSLCWKSEYVFMQRYDKYVFSVSLKNFDYGIEPSERSWVLIWNLRDYDGIDVSQHEKYLERRFDRDILEERPIELVERYYKKCPSTLHEKNTYDSLELATEALRKAVLSCGKLIGKDIVPIRCSDSSQRMLKAVPWLMYRREPFTWMATIMQDGKYASVSEDLRNHAISVYTNSPEDARIRSCENADKAISLLEEFYEVRYKHNSQ